MKLAWILLVIGCVHHRDARTPCERAADRTWKLEAAAWSDEERAALAPHRAEAVAEWTSACASWTPTRLACTLAARRASDLSSCAP
jgi:hypothetical protein